MLYQRSRNEIDNPSCESLSKHKMAANPNIETTQSTSFLNNKLKGYNLLN